MKNIKNLVFILLVLLLNSTCIAEVSNYNVVGFISPKVAVQNSSAYLDDALNGSTKKTRWIQKEITIYIPYNQNAKTIEKSFKKWEKSSDGLVTFKRVQKEEKADITIILVQNLDNELSGLTKTYYNDGEMLKADIFLVNNDDKPLSTNEVYMLSLHEIGHALGIIGHSVNPEDVMYESGLLKKKTLSKRDINTLKLLYRDNTNMVNANTVNLLDKIHNQEVIVEKYPDNTFQLLLLGDLYKKQKDYDTAITIYKKILQLDKSFAQAYYSVGYCYYYKGDKPEALNYFKQAVDAEPDNTIFRNMYLKVFYEINNKDSVGGQKAKDIR